MPSSDLRDETRDTLKEILGTEVDVNLHLDQLPLYEAKESCNTYQTNDQRYWSEYISLGRDFSLLPTNTSVKLHHTPFDDLVDEKDFCISDNDMEQLRGEFDGIHVRGCM